MEAKYYPIVVKIDERQFFIEDVRRWASGDVSNIEGLEGRLIVLFAQSALAWVENWEKEYKDDLVATFDFDTITGLHLEWKDVREKPATDKKVAPTITKGWQAQLDRIRVALDAALEEQDDNEGDPRPCIGYALVQLRKLGLFGGLKEKERSDGC